MRVGTDFTNYADEANLLSADWSTVWGSSFELTAVDDAGSEDGGRVLRLHSPSSNSRRAVSWDELGSIDEGVVFARFKIAAQPGSADNQQTISSNQVAFEGKYLSLDFTGSGVGAAGLFDMMASADFCCDGEFEKEERGLGVDSEGRWRADMNAVTSDDVFVVISDDAYVTPENTRSHARRYTPSDTEV